MDKINVQVYSLVSEKMTPVEKLQTIAKLGYTGAEFTADFTQVPLEEMKKVLAETGLEVPSVHCGLEQIESVIPYFAELGTKMIICPGTSFCNKAEAEEVAAELNRLGHIAKQYGIKIGFHNHTDEYYVDEGKTLYDWLIEASDPEVTLFQVDCGWCSCAGVNPVDFINKHAGKICAIHIKENGGVFLIVQLVSAVLSALYFLIFGVSYFEGKATYKKIPLLSLAPVLWGMSILISKLMKPVSFITVSELLFEIFALVFIMIFFLTFARVSTGVFTENGMWSVFGCGFAAALFGGIITIPRLVAAFVGLAPVTGHPFNITHFCVEIFIVVALFSLLGFGFKTGAKNLESFSDFSFEDEENIVIKSSSTSENTENVEKSQDSAVVEAVSDDEINSAMEKLFDKGSIAEIVDEVTEEETEEIVDEITEEETDVIVDEVTEEETEVIVDEVAEEETEVIVDEVTEEETEEIVDDVVEEEEEVDEFLSLADMVISDEDEDDDDYHDDTAVKEAVVEDIVEAASVPSEEADELSVSEEPVSEAEVKAKNEKPEKKKLFKKNKKQNESQEEEIKLVSLAELRKKNSDNE